MKLEPVVRWTITALFVVACGLLLVAFNAEAGHIPSVTGIPAADYTLQLQKGEGGGSGVIIRTYPSNERLRGRLHTQTCQVDLLTAAHVAANQPIYNDGNPFTTVHVDKKLDLAIMTGKVDHACSTLQIASIATKAPPFRTPIYRTGYPNGMRDWMLGYFGDCRTTDWSAGKDWCMHSIAVGEGASGSGMYDGNLLVAIVQKGAGPYALSVSPKHISEFIEYVYTKGTNSNERTDTTQ